MLSNNKKLAESSSTVPLKIFLKIIFRCKIENISSFEDEGFECVEVKNISVLNPYIEETNGIKIPSFKYFQASFMLEGTEKR